MTLMIWFVIAFGALIAVTGITLLSQPGPVIKILRRNSENIALQYVAIGLRLLLGILLIMFSEGSKFPLVIAVFGWLSLVAAIGLAVIGRDKFIRLMRWALSLADAWGRVAGAAAALLGIFLIYAFV